MCYSVVSPGMLGKKETCSREATSSCSCQQQPTLSWIENTNKTEKTAPPGAGVVVGWPGPSRNISLRFSYCPRDTSRSPLPRGTSEAEVRRGVEQPSTACTSEDREGRAVPGTAPPGAVCASSRREAPGTICPRRPLRCSAPLQPLGRGRRKPTRGTRKHGPPASAGSPGSHGPLRRDSTEPRGTSLLPGLAPRPPRLHSSVLGPRAPFRARPALALRSEPLPKLPPRPTPRWGAADRATRRGRLPLGQPGRSALPPPPSPPRLTCPPPAAGRRLPPSPRRQPLPAPPAPNFWAAPPRLHGGSCAAGGRRERAGCADAGRAWPGRRPPPAGLWHRSLPQGPCRSPTAAGAMAGSGVRGAPGDTSRDTPDLQASPGESTGRFWSRLSFNMRELRHVSKPVLYPQLGYSHDLRSEVAQVKQSL